MIGRMAAFPNGQPCARTDLPAWTAKAIAAPP
jgi:hypothetical protein